MSDPRQVSGNRVYCHLCEHQYDRAQGGLECPECGTDFVEILESDASPEGLRSTSPPPIPPHPIHGEIRQSPPPIPQHPLHDHNPWANVPDPDEDDITRIEFNNGRTHGSFAYSSRTFTWSNTRGANPAAEEIARNFETMLSNIMGTGRQPHTPSPMMGGGGSGFHFMGSTNGTRAFGTGPPQSGGPPSLFSMLFPSAQTPNQGFRQGNPFEFLNMLLNGNGQHGDAVFTNEAFDRVMTQLMEQNQGTGAPPASEDAINSLEKRKVDKTMMGSDGTAECSICMDNVEIGDEVTFLPCNHWFHEDCVVSWLKEHDTCPHCRQPISNTQESEPSSRMRSSRRRSTRRTSQSTSQPPEQQSTRYGSQSMEPPPGERWSSGPRSPDRERPPSDRQDGRPDAPGGVGGWFRNRMPF